MRPPLPPLEVQVYVCERALGATELLCFAREGTVESLKRRATVCGGSGGGLPSWWCDGKGAASDQVDPEWFMGWPRMAEIVRAGITVDTAVGLHFGLTRYVCLHCDPWQSDVPPFVPGGWQVSAASDPVAYELIWWPEFCAASDMLRAAERDVFARALDVLAVEERVDEQLAMAL